VSSIKLCMDTTVWRRSALWRLHTRYLLVILDRLVTARMIAGIASPTPSCQPASEMAWLVPWDSSPVTTLPTSLAPGLKTFTLSN
jgi:hypothetical protein